MSRPKSRDRDREFVKIRKFWRFSTVCLDLDRELVNFIIFLGRDFSICQDFWAWCTSKSLKNVKISRQISLRLNKSWKNSLRLDKSWQSWYVSTLSTKISTRQSLDWKSLDFKNLEREKKCDLDCRENLDTWKKLVSTRRTFSISISIGLDCRDHQAYFLKAQ